MVNTELPILARPEARVAGPRITSARFADGFVEVELSGESESQLRFRPSALPGLRKVKEQSLLQMRVTAGGQAVLLSDGSGEFTVDSILSGVLGVVTVAENARRAAQVRTEAHREAARVNGAKGGRPRKKVVDEPFSAKKVREHLPPPVEAQELDTALN